MQSWYQRLPIVQYLLDLGADVDAAGEQGYTPLHISVKFNFPEIMELLLLRVKVNAFNFVVRVIYTAT